VKSKNKILVFGGAAAAVVILVLGFFAFRPKGESEEVKKMRETLAELQRVRAEDDAKKAALTGAADAAKAKQADLVRQASEMKDATERAKLLEQVEAEKRKQADIERQQKELEDKRKLREAQLKEQEQKLAKAAPVPPPPVAKPVEQPKPAAPPPVEAPKPAPVEAPKPTPAAAPTAAPAPTGTPVVVEETQARMVSQAAPAFPARAQQMRWEATKSHTVRLRVYVDANGRPQKVNVTQSVAGPFGFDESATDAAMRSTYAPATRDGKPVASWIEYNVTFQAQVGRR